MTEAAFWWVNTVTVETYLGTTSTGPKWADPVTVSCWVEDTTDLVRNSDGQEVVSTTMIMAPLDKAALFPPTSKVTLTDRTAQVIKLGRFDSGILNLGLDHIEVALT